MLLSTAEVSILFTSMLNNNKNIFNKNDSLKKKKIIVLTELQKETCASKICRLHVVCRHCVGDL